MKMTNNRFRIPFLILASIVLISSGSAARGQDSDLSPQQLINNMSRATHALNYDGIFVYRRGNQINTMRIIHKNGGDGEMERLVSLTGHPREVIRNRDTVTCIFPDNKSVMVEKSRNSQLMSTQLPQPIETISDFYRFTYVGPERVAGRTSRVVTIQPRDNYRYGYQLWIDEDSYLLLKSELKNASGFPLEQIMFTKLDVLDSVPDELLQPSNTGQGFKWYNSMPLEADEGFAHYLNVRWIPDGFRMSNREVQSIASSSNPVDHIVYTDGMAMVSIFIEKLKNRSDFIQGPSRMGAVNAFARMANGYQVTAVGEVPQATVQKMAISVVARQ